MVLFCYPENRSEGLKAIMLTLIPITLAVANAFVAGHHRHHQPVVGHKYSIGCSANGALVGVVIVGRPVRPLSGRRRDAGGHALVYGRNPKRLQHPVRGGGSRCQGDGLFKDHHLYAGHGKRREPTRSRLALRRLGRRQTMDGQTQTGQAAFPAPNEAAIQQNTIKEVISWPTSPSPKT